MATFKHTYSSAKSWVESETREAKRLFGDWSSENLTCQSLSKIKNVNKRDLSPTSIQFSKESVVVDIRPDDKIIRGHHTKARRLFQTARRFSSTLCCGLI